MAPQHARRILVTVIPILLAVILATVGIAFVGVYGERETHRALDSVSESAAVRVTGAVAQDTLLLEGLRAYWLGSQEVTADEFATYAANVFGSSRGLTAVQWIDSDNVVRYVYPSEGDNLKSIGFDNAPFLNRMGPLSKARESRSAVVTDPLMLVQGYPGIALYVPIFRGDEYLGSAVGVTSLEGLLGDTLAALKPYSSTGYVAIGTLRVPLDGKAIYDETGRPVVGADGKSGGKGDGLANRMFDVIVTPVSVADRQWHIVVGKTAHPFIRPETALATFFGFIFIMILSGSLFLSDRQAERLRRFALRERDFTSLVSHQLKLPLTQLSWLIDTAFEGGLTSEQQARVNDMRVIVKGSVHLVNDLLSISRIERGTLKIERGEVPVAMLVDEALLPFRESGMARKVRIETDVPAGVSAYVDRQKAIEAVRNVIDNAIRYSPEGSTVLVTAAKADEGMTRIVVRDDGRGIPKDIRGRIFEKSTMYAKKGTGEGAGLGLYLTKQFIVLMGGNVTFETSPKGTTFFITVPAEKTR